MGGCTAQKAFDSLWSVTDEIFKYVSDIRTILNGAKCSVGEILPSDAPSYENPVPQQFIEHLNQKVTCLENLNDKREAILVEFSTALRSDDLNEKKQIGEIPSENAYSNPRDNALESFVSYTRTRHAALKENLDLANDAYGKLVGFDRMINKTQTTEEDPIRGCPKEAQHIFLEAMKISQRLSTNLSNDRVELLREGKVLEEMILKIPHEANEETSKILENVQSSYQRIMNGKAFTVDDYILPILKEYLEIQTRTLMTITVESVIVNIQHSIIKHTRMVQAYNQALQSLADHLIT